MMPAIAKTVIQEPVLMKDSNLFKIPKILADHYHCKKKKKSHDIKHQNYQSKETLSETKKTFTFQQKVKFSMYLLKP